mgnify:CR=1 FL=1
MSTKAKLTLLASCIVSGYIVYSVHIYQQEERDIIIDHGFIFIVYK